MFEAEFLYNPDSYLRHSHGANLVVCADDTLLVCWYAYPENETQGGRLVLARQPADGGTWSESEFLNLESRYSQGNPVLYEDPSGKLTLLFVKIKGSYWSDANLSGMESEDGGRTWANPSSIWGEQGLMVRHPPLLLQDHSWLLPVYNERLWCSHLLKSPPGPRRQWQMAKTFTEEFLIQPVLIQEFKGKMALLFRPHGNRKHIWRSHSSDGGLQWCNPVRTILPSPLSGIGGFYLDNRLFAVYHHTQEHQRYPLHLAYSEDEGVTWSPPILIDGAQHELSYPSFTVDKSGTVHGVYTYNRRMIKYVTFDREWIEQKRSEVTVQDL